MSAAATAHWTHPWGTGGILPNHSWLKLSSSKQIQSMPSICQNWWIFVLSSLSESCIIRSSHIPSDRPALKGLIATPEVQYLPKHSWWYPALFWWELIFFIFFLSFQAVSCLLTSNTACLRQLENVCERGKKKTLKTIWRTRCQTKTDAMEEENNKRDSETFAVTTASQLVNYSWTRIEARSFPLQPRKMWSNCNHSFGNNSAESEQCQQIQAVSYRVLHRDAFSRQSPDTVHLVFYGIAIAGTALPFIQRCTTAGDGAASARLY